MSPDALSVAEHDGRLELATEAGALPQGWVRASIVELAGADGLMLDGDWVETKDQDPNGEIRLIQLADIGDGIFQDRSNRYLTRETAERLRCTYLSSSDVLIARMAAPLGRACIFPGLSQRAVTAVDVCIWRGGSAAVEPRWLMHIINSPDARRLILSDASGTTRQRISGGKLKRLCLPIPPLAEQRRIVARIEELFAEIAEGEAALERTREGLDTWRRALLKAAVTGELTPDWREANRPAETGANLLARIRAERELSISGSRRGRSMPLDHFDPSSRLELPERWAWGRIGDIAEIDSGVTPTGAEDQSALSGELPWFKVSSMNLCENEIEMRHSRWWFSRSQASELGFKIIRKGALIFPKLGGALLTNKRRTLATDAALDMNLMAVSCSEVLQTYVNRFFDLFNLINLADGSVVPQVKKARIQAIPIAIPPAEEIKVIVKRLDQALGANTEVIRALAEAQAQASAQRQSILKATFEGRLVPQDPTDEPASALLARLRNGEPVRRRRPGGPRPAGGAQATLDL